MSVAAKLTRVT